jgi:hypothetical protein
MPRLQRASTVIKHVNAIRRLLLDRNDVRDKRHLRRAEETEKPVLK